jgi:UDP-glucuronate 4-epimerase
MKILVTGSAGFIGFHLVKALLDRGDEVVGIDNINDYYDVNLKYGRLSQLGIELSGKSFETSTKIVSGKYAKHTFLKIDIADKEALNALFETEAFDAVCNLAAQAGVRYSLENPHAYVQSNVVGFMNILEACRSYEVCNLSYASSSSVYGLNRSHPFKTSDHTDHPISIYAATKKSNEMMAHSYAHLYGIRTTGLRFFTVYGPWGRPDMAPMLFADAILHGRPINIFNHGNMSRDFTYIDDIIEGMLYIIDNPAEPNADFDAKNPDPSISSAPYKIYNIGHNAPVSLMAFVKMLETALGKKAEKHYMGLQDGDVVSTYADVSGLIKDFGYHSKVALEEGIFTFTNWYQTYYKEQE